jgi:hypothetical protein
MATAQQTKDKARPEKGRKQKAARQGGGQAETTTKAGGGGVTVPVPIVIPRVKVYHPSVLGPSRVGRAGRSVAGRLPSPGRLAFYGGLGAAAVSGVIGWPVAVAIGAGTAIVRRARAGDQS